MWGVKEDGSTSRKNAAQALKNAGATPAEIAEVIGHEKGFTLSVYAPMALPVERLQELACHHGALEAGSTCAHIPAPRCALQ